MSKKTSDMITTIILIIAFTLALLPMFLCGSKLIDCGYGWRWDGFCCKGKYIKITITKDY